MHTSGGTEPAPAIYPASKTLYLQAIKEKVPIFEGKFRITEDLTVAASKVGDGIRAVFSAGKTVPIVGELHYSSVRSGDLLSTYVGPGEMGATDSTS